MRTMTNAEANARCGSVDCDMVGQVLVGSDNAQPLAVEDSLEECVVAINRISGEAPITADDINLIPGDVDTLTAWRIV